MQLGDGFFLPMGSHGWIVGEELNSQRPELVGLDPLAAVVAPGLAAHLVV